MVDGNKTCSIRPSPIPNSFHPIPYTRQLKPFNFYRIPYGVVHLKQWIRIHTP
jgi:hypothetical protein